MIFNSFIYRNLQMIILNYDDLISFSILSDIIDIIAFQNFTVLFLIDE